MTAVPLLPKNAPFSPEEIGVLNKVVSRTTPLQRSWLAGFFAGFEAAQGALAAPAAAARPRASLTVLYATESGNAEGLAIKAKKAAQKHGLDARVIDMADADMGLLANAKNLIVYVATWGEGEPPGRAADFYHALMSDGAPRLDDVRFAVLALGDTAYTQFCATGGRGRAALHAATPLEAEITALINLNGTGSTRETWHVELASDAPGFTYVPGDAIGIVLRTIPTSSPRSPRRQGSVRRPWFCRNCARATTLRRCRGRWSRRMQS